MGSGFRTFQSGEVLTSSNVQNFLMDQAVMVFAGTAARGSAISSPETGMVSYRTDGTADSKREGFEFYDGAAWTRLIPLGSGLVKTGSATGSSASSISVTDCFSSTYTNYCVVATFTANTADITIRMRTTTDDSGANYNWTESFSRIGTSSTGSTVAASATSWSGPGDSNSTTPVAIYTIWRPNNASTTYINGMTLASDALSNYRWQLDGFLSTSTQYTGISFLSTGLTGTVTVYGYSL